MHRPSTDRAQAATSFDALLPGAPTSSDDQAPRSEAEPFHHRHITAHAGLIGLITISVWCTSVLIGGAVNTVAGDRMAPWILGRAAGLTAYLLLLTVVSLGLVLSHPGRARLRRPAPALRIRAHVTLAVFCLAFTAVHVVVLATDRYAGVGWRGAILPMAARYRPLPVTLGLISLYAGALTGVTAGLAGRLFARLWWPLHKAAGLVFVLAWLHGVLAGSDSALLRVGYLTSGAAVVMIAAARYVAPTSTERAEAARAYQNSRSGGPG